MRRSATESEPTNTGQAYEQLAPIYEYLEPTATYQPIIQAHSSSIKSEHVYDDIIVNKKRSKERKQPDYSRNTPLYLDVLGALVVESSMNNFELKFG